MDFSASSFLHMKETKERKNTHERLSLRFGSNFLLSKKRNESKSFTASKYLPCKDIREELEVVISSKNRIMDFVKPQVNNIHLLEKIIED